MILYVLAAIACGLPLSVFIIHGVFAVKAKQYAASTAFFGLGVIMLLALAALMVGIGAQ